MRALLLALHCIDCFPLIRLKYVQRTASDHTTQYIPDYSKVLKRVNTNIYQALRSIVAELRSAGCLPVHDESFMRVLLDYGINACEDIGSACGSALNSS